MISYPFIRSIVLHIVDHWVVCVVWSDAVCLFCPWPNDIMPAVGARASGPEMPQRPEVGQSERCISCSLVLVIHRRVPRFTPCTWQQQQQHYQS
uniref:Putative secreted protein n=1 Tax=Anopheles darlingi TaxID=43151 RepID=A0A2M4DBR1_ANODA